MTKPGVIYLQKDKFQLFSPFLGSILEFRFLPTVVRDLDVINFDLLGNQVKDFVTSGKIPAGDMVIVLCDNAYFIKDFLYPNPVQIPQKPGQPIVAVPPKITLDDLKKQADLFIEHVPYDNVVSKTIPLKNGIRVCAANQDLYGALKLAFETLGFTIDIVLPGLVLGNNISTHPVMDSVMASSVLQKANTLKQYDLLPQTAFQPHTDNATDNSGEEDVVEQQDKKPNKKRLIALSGVFASLVIVLIIVFVQSQGPTTAPQSPAHAETPQAAAPPPATAVTTQTTVATPTPIIVVDATQTQSLNVQIVNASDSATLGQTLRTGLSRYAFKSITMQTQSNIGAASTVVSFSANVTQPVRNVILDEVRKIKSDITIQEKQDGLTDITIILGK